MKKNYFETTRTLDTTVSYLNMERHSITHVMTSPNATLIHTRTHTNTHTHALPHTITTRHDAPPAAAPLAANRLHLQACRSPPPSGAEPPVPAPPETCRRRDDNPWNRRLIRPPGTPPPAAAAGTGGAPTSRDCSRSRCCTARSWARRH